MATHHMKTLSVFAELDFIENILALHTGGQPKELEDTIVRPGVFDWSAPVAEHQNRISRYSLIVELHQGHVQLSSITRFIDARIDPSSKHHSLQARLNVPEMSHSLFSDNTVSGHRCYRIVGKDKAMEFIANMSAFIVPDSASLHLAGKPINIPRKENKWMMEQS